jgi:hypothetical protein
MPIGAPPASTTGTALIRRSSKRRAISPVGVSGATVATSRVITSRAFMPSRSRPSRATNGSGPGIMPDLTRQGPERRADGFAAATGLLRCHAASDEALPVAYDRWRRQPNANGGDTCDRRTAANGRHALDYFTTRD